MPPKMLGTVLGWRWRISNGGPDICQSLHFGEAVRERFFALGRRWNILEWPHAFHHSEPREKSHAHWLAEDDDGDGFIDHVLVYCDVGIPTEAIRVLACMQSITFHQSSLQLEPVWMGRENTGGLFGPSDVWVSLTPYMTPRRRLYDDSTKERPKETSILQMQGELRNANFAESVAIKAISMELPSFHPRKPEEFRVHRRYGKLPPRCAVSEFVGLKFDSVVNGPIALGYASHFGLGLMRPLLECNGAANVLSDE
jgi:CRISPR-associated protein Csb2